MPLFQAHISEQITQLKIVRQLKCKNAIKNVSLSWNTPRHQQSMIFSYRGAYITAVYFAGPQNPYKISSPLLPLNTWYLLPLKLSNKLNLPLLKLKEYRILPYSLLNNSEDGRVKQH